MKSLNSNDLLTRRARASRVYIWSLLNRTEHATLVLIDGQSERYRLRISSPSELSRGRPLTMLAGETRIVSRERHSRNE